MSTRPGCIAGALTESAFRTKLIAAGFEDVQITPNHQVHEAGTGGDHPGHEAKRETGLSSWRPQPLG